MSVRFAALAVPAALSLVFALPAPAAAQSAPAAAPATPATPRRYPAARRDTVIDIYFGTRVPAPYRWLEDLNGPETRAWIAAENAITARYLDSLPGRERIRQELTELWNYPRVTLPFREAGRLFYRRNTGLQRQSVVYTRSAPNAAERMVIDPNAISPDGSVALAAFSVSPDGKHYAYGLAQGGSDLQDWYVRDLATGRQTVDTIRNVKFSDASWTKDGAGFFYSRFATPEQGKELSGANTQGRIFYHRLGTPQSEDRLIYERPDDPKLFIGGSVSEDGRYLWIFASPGGTENELWYKDLGDPLHPRLDAPVRPVSARADAEYAPLGNMGDTLYLRSSLGAPRRRIVRVVLPDTVRSRWRDVVAEGPYAIESAVLAGGRLAVQYLADVKSRLDLFGLDGRPQGTVALPGIGTVAGLSARADTPELWYAYTSFLVPTTIYRFDLRTARSTAFEPTRTAFDPAPYETRQVFYQSKDGTRVPMFVTLRKDAKLDGTNPTLLYAYGGFDVSILPGYSPAVAEWLRMGGVYAVPNLRGGGEYGEAWHQAGMKEKKQNVFDDFIAAAEWLVAEKYTSPAKLAIRGGSNGGLLVGAVMTQRPDLYGVALPAVGVMDMLRFQKFTGGTFWVPEYGSSDDSTAFRYLLKYSPLQNVKPGACYPATLLTTADHDDRVVPSHTYQFGAALQAAQGCAHPVLVRIETEGSHGYRPTDKQIAEYADLWAFTAANLGMVGLQP